MTHKTSLRWVYSELGRTSGVGRDSHPPECLHNKGRQTVIEITWTESRSGMREGLGGCGGLMGDNCSYFCNKSRG